MLDEFTRQCVAIRVERQIRSEQVLATLWQAMATYGIPEHIRSDNGTEFVAQKIQAWLRDNRIKTLYIDPGSPWQNGYIESFHSRFRDECLNREWLLNLRKVRVVIADWQQHDNEERPHCRLGYLSPEDFSATKKPHPKWTKTGKPANAIIHSNSLTDSWTNRKFLSSQSQRRLIQPLPLSSARQSLFCDPRPHRENSQEGGTK